MKTSNILLKASLLKAISLGEDKLKEKHQDFITYLAKELSDTRAIDLITESI